MNPMAAFTELCFTASVLAKEDIISSSESSKAADIHKILSTKSPNSQNSTRTAIISATNLITCAYDK